MQHALDRLLADAQCGLNNTVLHAEPRNGIAHLLLLDQYTEGCAGIVQGLQHLQQQKTCHARMPIFTSIVTNQHILQVLEIPDILESGHS